MSLLSQLIPEIDELMPTRLVLLRSIANNQPVGRRQLAALTGLSERDVRRECEILRETAVIEFQNQGMSLLPDGEKVLRLLGAYGSSLFELQGELRTRLGIRSALIVRRQADDARTLTEIGRVAAARLRVLLRDGDRRIVGLTGGHSIERVVAGYKDSVSAQTHAEDRVIVSARGGLGHNYEIQANTLVEKLAAKTGAQYVTLLSQDSLSAESIEKLKSEPAIKRALELIRGIDVLVFGIGRADVMSVRRELDPELIRSILSKGAVAEAFGYYFDRGGRIVHEISTIGIDLEQYRSLNTVIAVAGGEEKADAILAVSGLNPNLELVTDEAAAREILRKIDEGRGR